MSIEKCPHCGKGIGGITGEELAELERLQKKATPGKFPAIRDYQEAGLELLPRLIAEIHRQRTEISGLKQAEINRMEEELASFGRGINTRNISF